MDQPYYNTAKQIYHALLNKVPKYEIGEHEWDNSWIYTSDIYAMAEACTKNRFIIIGVCYDLPWVKDMFETGIVAETQDGTRFWCHCYTEALEDLLQECKQIFK